jgi:signal transduction histidine kinase
MNVKNEKMNVKNEKMNVKNEKMNVKNEKMNVKNEKMNVKLERSSETQLKKAIEQLRDESDRIQEAAIEQLRDESDRIQEAVEEAIQEEEIRQLEALADFETEIDNICHRNPNASRDTAIRWILDARGMLDETDAGYICFRLGLSYEEADLFKQVCSVAQGNLLNPWFQLNPQT